MTPKPQEEDLKRFWAVNHIAVVGGGTLEKAAPEHPIPAPIPHLWLFLSYIHDNKAIIEKRAL